MAVTEFKMKLGAVVPDFICETSNGTRSFHEVLGSPPAWTLLFSFGGYFDAVSATELAQLVGLAGEIGRLGVKLIGLSVGGVPAKEERCAWFADVLAVAQRGGADVSEWPACVELLADPSGEAATRLGICDASSLGLPVVANVLIAIGPEKTCRLCTLYPARIGRDFRETFRTMLSLVVTQDFMLATPVEWQVSDRIIVAPGLSTEVAREKFGSLATTPLPSGKTYLRYVDCPDISAASFQQIVEGASAAPPPAMQPIGDIAANGFRAVLSAEFPDFRCQTTKGDMAFHDFLADGLPWTVLFSHPKDFTPVCTTELGACQSLCNEFAARGVKLIGLSCDSVDDHHAWSRDVLSAKGLQGEALDFPLIGDKDRSIAALLGMLDPLEQDAEGVPMPARALFLIGPDRRLRFSVIYPATSGRSFSEILRVIDAVGLSERHRVAMPAAWSPGGQVFPQALVDDGSAQSLPSGRLYLNYSDCPLVPAALAA